RDWSSDVCSSDLKDVWGAVEHRRAPFERDRLFPAPLVPRARRVGHLERARQRHEEALDRAGAEFEGLPLGHVADPQTGVAPAGGVRINDGVPVALTEFTFAIKPT